MKHSDIADVDPLAGHFRDFHIAASLKPKHMAEWIAKHIARFPRLPYRGLIEATVACNRSFRHPTNFRDFHIAASLKLDVDLSRCGGALRHFRDFHIAASLKPSSTNRTISINGRFPRLPYRGLIEAVLDGRPIEEKLADFRDFHIAASLKLLLLELKPNLLKDFRDFHIAASLKPCYCTASIRSDGSNFRDFHIAASLKLQEAAATAFGAALFPRLPYRGLIEANLIPVNRRSRVNRFPRLPYRGLIEAGYLSHWVLVPRNFRDFHIAASLKLVEAWC